LIATSPRTGVFSPTPLPRTHSAVLSQYTARYHAWGQGKPLVIVPGLAGGIELVAPLAACLARRGFRVISYQLRGEDDCFALRRRFELPDLVDDLDELLDELRLERPLVLGVSFGGGLALHLAARQPNRLSGVIAQGANIRFEKSLLRQVAGHVLSYYPLPTNSPFVNQFYNLLFGGKPTDRQLADFVTTRCWNTDQGVMAHRFQLAEQLELQPLLRRLKLPLMLINGERDLLVPSQGLDELARGMPHAIVKQIPGAGHLAFVSHAEMMADLVASFASKRRLARMYTGAEA
jgi:pimeloyl-ACP methyl ester carboxylesterase